jgi:amino-acid N-acetyltransferase
MISTAVTLPGIGFSAAKQDDLDAVRTLLAGNGLPEEDIAGHLEHFLLAWDGAVLVGTVGVELLGNSGLLRSLCVRREYRNRGLATALSERAEAYARNAGLHRLYLLTTTAKTFFERAGYSVCSRDRLPPEIQGTAEFRSLCPATATCMARDLDAGALYLPKELLPLREDVPGARMWAVGLSCAMLTYFEVEPATRFETHSHEGEQITTVVAGELFFEIGSQVVRVGRGEAIAIPAKVLHAVYTTEAGASAFDAWSPPPPRYQRDAGGR